MEPSEWERTHLLLCMAQGLVWSGIESEAYDHIKLRAPVKLKHASLYAHRPRGGRATSGALVMSEAGALAAAGSLTRPGPSPWRPMAPPAR